jgi:acyl carrier protein
MNNHVSDEDTKRLIREFLLTECLPGESPGNLKDDTPLVTGGILDSLAMLHLVTFVEECFEVEVDAWEAGGDNFDTVERVARLVRRKRAETA